MSEIIKLKAKLSEMMKIRANLRTELYLELMEASDPGKDIKESEYAYKVRQICCLFYAHRLSEVRGLLGAFLLGEDWLETAKRLRPFFAVAIEDDVRELLKIKEVLKEDLIEVLKEDLMEELPADLMEKLHE